MNNNYKSKFIESTIKKRYNICFIFIFCTILNILPINMTYATSTSSNVNLTENLQLTTFIYDKDGNKIEELHGNEDRILVEYNDLPKHAINSIIAIEDERFFSHKGVDIKRTAGAIFTYITNNGKSDFGGSTITQQLVKNITKDKESSITRKIREWIRALKLEKVMKKEDIFLAYVNTIYFGEGSYGIEVASKNYFGKSIKDLNIAEAAIMAAAIQSPESTNPYKSEESKNRLLDRQKVVLNKMLQLGFITQEEFQIAKETNIEFKKSGDITKVQSYFIDAVIEQVISDIMKKEDVNYQTAKKMIYTNGYKIYTTLDQNIQNSIDSCYERSNLFVPDADGNLMQSAMVVIDQKTGNVLGIKGGVGEKTSNLSLNRATQSYRQPGSCMKPLGAYGPAFEKGILTPNSRLEDAPITIGKWSPKNYYDSFYGNVSVKDAIAKSMNTPAVRANQRVDKEFAFSFAKNAGLKSLLPEDKDASPLSLGGLTRGVTPLEMASAYATIANGGMYNEPKFYTKLLNKNGEEYIVKNSEPKKAMKESTAYFLTTCLKAVVEPGGTAYGAVKVGNMGVAGKTGNTNDDYDQWFCGFTPHYTIACWNGYDKNKSINRPYPYYSVRMFNMVMNDISINQEVKDFIKPASIVEVEICKSSGLLPTEACRKDYRGSQVIKDWVDLDSIGNRSCDVHEMVRICSITNLRASANCNYAYMRPCIKRSDDPEKDKYYLTPVGFCGGRHNGNYNNNNNNNFFNNLFQ